MTYICTYLIFRKNTNSSYDFNRIRVEIIPIFSNILIVVTCFQLSV